MYIINVLFMTVHMYVHVHVHVAVLIDAQDTLYIVHVHTCIISRHVCKVIKGCGLTIEGHSQHY